MKENGNGGHWVVRELEEDERQQALTLASSVFMEYEAPDYSEQGIVEFKRTMKNQQYTTMLRYYGAFVQEEAKAVLVGIIATRSNGNHIALFFVQGKYHRLGIGKSLFELMAKDNQSGRLTVNSSPYAVLVYHRLGFRDTDVEQVTEGIRYTPMELFLDK